MLGSNYFYLHQVTVKTFQMAKTLVTNKQYQACVEAGACTQAERYGQNFSGDDQPVVGVDWNQAQAFAKWAGGRLPTETEWEYAARSGGKEQEYPWGDEGPSCELTVFSSDGTSGGNGCGRNSTWPVCSKPKGNTKQGLCDMAGNVWEWLQDWYHDSYNGVPTDGSAWESPAGSDRVVRGGTWDNEDLTPDDLPVDSRRHFAPAFRSNDGGLRLARSSLPPESLTPQKLDASHETKPAAVPARVTPDNAGIEWVTIPGGSFMMGSESEQPVHRVTVRSFEMAKTEVTKKQYRACVEAGACTPPCDFRDRFRAGFRAGDDQDDQPVVGVFWSQAKDFSAWVGGRLPTEAEWEYAARSLGKDWKYPWGNENVTRERAVGGEDCEGAEPDSDCGESSSMPVCSKSKGNTQQGLCDMAGNVTEWVQDKWHNSYNGAPIDGSAWDDAGSYRVVRGGSWLDYAVRLLTTIRGNANDPGWCTGDLGFRPARSSSR